MSENEHVDNILKQALAEDIGSGDITTCAVIPEKQKSRASLIAKEPCVVAGLHFAERVFQILNPKVTFKTCKKDGETVKKGAVIAEVSGNTRVLLTGERTALNVLQRLSGIATLTRKYVACLKGLRVKITDTRKTTPGLRYMEKYAVRMGGGYNHRYGLYDGILIKDNHIRSAGGIQKTVRLARINVNHLFRIEVEVKSIEELRKALLAESDIIMLDNMALKDIKDAVKIIRRHNPDVIIEASGNIKLENIRTVAETGVDLISVGSLTHSAKAVDISMDIRPRHKM
jgi:nicotinate-nucleotide pyrophosphorylase (carboxylating)